MVTTSGGSGHSNREIAAPSVIFGTPFRPAQTFHPGNVGGVDAAGTVQQAHAVDRDLVERVRLGDGARLRTASRLLEATSHRCDQRGCGRSSPSPSPTSDSRCERWAADL